MLFLDTWPSVAVFDRAADDALEPERSFYKCVHNWIDYLPLSVITLLQDIQ